MRPAKEKSEIKHKVGRPEKRVVESISDTPENIAKALFGIAPNGNTISVK